MAAIHGVDGGPAGPFTPFLPLIHPRFTDRSPSRC